MPMSLIDKKISKADLLKLAQERYGDLVKAVVDIEQEIMMIGGELHADEEAFLIDQGSHQKNLWGINLYPEKAEDEFIERVVRRNPAPSGAGSDELSAQGRKASPDASLPYPSKNPLPAQGGVIQFDSVINLRPSQGNRSRDVLDPKVREKIKEIIERLIGES